MQKNLEGFVIFYDISNEILSKNWKKLYAKGGNFNLSYEWCAIWAKYFLCNKKTFIITLWKNNELVLLAPFYKKRGKLVLIGTKPDLYDEFGILYQNIKHVDEFITYLQQNLLDIAVKYINSQSELGKFFVKRFSQKAIRQSSHVLETKPFIDLDEFEFKRKQKDDFVRCCNNSVKNYGEALKFEFQTEKNPEFIKEFINFHKSRWGGGLLEKKPKICDFLEELFLNTNFCILSRLSLENSNKTVAYHLGFADSDGKFCSSMPTYDINFKKISPGKVLLYNIIYKLKQDEIKVFDFGRGSEPYKNWFCTGEDILFNISTFNSNKLVFSIRNLLNKVFR